MEKLEGGERGSRSLENSKGAAADRICNARVDLSSSTFFNSPIGRKTNDTSDLVEASAKDRHARGSTLYIARTRADEILLMGTLTIVGNIGLCTEKSTYFENRSSLADDKIDARVHTRG